jgi:hypothetical protein
MYFAPRKPKVATNGGGTEAPVKKGKKGKVRPNAIFTPARGDIKRKVMADGKVVDLTK